MKIIVVCSLMCFDWNAGLILLYCLFELQLGEVWELEPDRARRSRMATTAREGERGVYAALKIYCNYTSKKTN